MTVSMDVRTAVPALDALIHLGTALQHAHAMTTIAAIETAVAAVSDRATSDGATITEVFESFTAGLRSADHIPAERDEQVVIVHLAQSLVYVDGLPLVLAVSKALSAAVAADTENPAVT